MRSSETEKAMNANSMIGMSAAAAVGIAIATVGWLNPSEAVAATVISQSSLLAPANPCRSGAPGVPPPQPQPEQQQPDQQQPGQEPALTGSFNYDGTILLSDGRIMNPDGTYKPVAQVIHPPGSTRLPNGGVQHPDGKVFNADGKERKPIYGDGFAITPDGTVLDEKGECFPVGVLVRHNYDGTVTFVDAQGVQVVGLDGKPAGEPVLGRAKADGSVATLDGRILNADGSERKTTTLPDGRVLYPDGTTTSGQQAPNRGGSPN